LLLYYSPKSLVLLFEGPKSLLLLFEAPPISPLLLIQEQEALWRFRTLALGSSALRRFGAWVLRCLEEEQEQEMWWSSQPS
jgi:hypothetical protein